MFKLVWGKGVSKKTRLLIIVFFMMCLLTIGYLVFAVWWHSLYDPVFFNCRHMTVCCALFFKEIVRFPGISIVHGTSPVDSSKGHCWLRLGGWLEFECTGLFPKFFNRNCDYYNVYLVEDL